MDGNPGGALLGATLAALAASALGPAASSADEPRLHRVTIELFTFRPPTLEIRPGDTVEWINRDTAPHTATEAKRVWDSKLLSKGGAYRRTFRRAGTVHYFCVFHPHMRGRITVVDR